MKQIVSVLILLLLVSSAFGQTKKKGKVKRKYRKTEKVRETQPEVFLSGKVRDADKNLLIGASIVIDGLKKGVHTNAEGEYFFSHLPEDKLRLKISFIGYETKIIDYITRPGRNFHNVTLDEKKYHLNPITVHAQKREQQILDIPLAISAINAEFIEQSNITELSQLSEYVPGFYIREQGANRPSFVIRGLTSDEISPGAQPRVSVYYNNVPINRPNTASVELFDMEQVEVLKGPQNTLFGRGAQIGAINFISKKPGNTQEGFVSAGFGDFKQKEVRGAINVPILEDKLFVRAAGVYSHRDGYVTNTFGGTLNGLNTVGGRLSARFLPAYNQKADLIINYQKDETPGIAFTSRIFPNTLGETDIFTYNSSLEKGEELGTGKNIFDATLHYKYFINEHKYWSSTSSFRKGKSSARWDGDGTAAAAIDMAEDAGSSQFYQEIRYNFSRRSRMNGSLGASYWREKSDQTYWFSPNEQNMFHLFFDPSYLIMPDGQPYSVEALPQIPQLGGLGGMPLPINHEEENYSNAKNQAAEIFLDISHELTKRIFFNGGVRGVYDWNKLESEATFIGGSESTLGMLTGNYPNLFFKPSETKEIKNKGFSYTWRAGLKFKFNENANLFANYSIGRRPNVLQFTSAGEPEILDAENVINYDAGFKTHILTRILFDVVGFYQEYTDFQTSAWIADPTSGEFNYKVKNGGQATAYGAEANLKIAVIKGLDLYGNYAWLNATFDDTDKSGAKQEYAGNRFRLAPEHSFSAGMNASANITPDILFFINPSYSYKSQIYFEDANTPGLEQEAYGTLNVNGGLELDNPNIILTVFGTNLLNEQFVISAGNTGSLFGVPTFVPGAPKMIGTKLTWKF